MTEATVRPPRFVLPSHWPSLPFEAAGDAWKQLRTWVEEYIERFAIDSRTIPPCWYRHNAMVEALSALRDHERHSYEFASNQTAGVDFIRACGEIGLFLKEQASRTGCTSGAHRPDPTGRTQTDDADWSDFVGRDITRREIADR
jgi:hypothetical protein